MTIEAPSLTWEFPLPRTHTGVLLGNGIQGLMVWGVDTLNITVGRAGFWDHRGGNAFANRTTYREVRRMLEANDEAGIRAAFATTPSEPGLPERPTQIGGGRLELRFPNGLRPSLAELQTSNATLHITLTGDAGASSRLTIHQAMDAELAWVELDPALAEQVEVTLRPAWDFIGEHLAAVGIEPPLRTSHATGGSFLQTLPADDPLALAWKRKGNTLLIATALGPQAAQQADNALEQADLAAARSRADAWWSDYWRSVPRLRLPDPSLQHTWDYGVYKLAGLTTPGGIPASLQGPWLEEYQMLPWSSDYHFNINIQMIYWPCLPTGRFDHFWPLWDMIMGWLPQLKDNAAKFFDAPDALMMPHAVDDRCQVIGNFWTGTIDQACIAWMAQMAWLHYRYSGDERVLREVAWPLLVGAFNGYWAMLETIERDGKQRLSLPVSVSPEYNGAQMNAWGRDASFQLAALHFVAQALPQAAQILGEPFDERWAQVSRDLPPYTLAAVDSGQPRIALWDGQDLDESHRHHSHLGAIYPFCTIDPYAEEHKQIVQNSLQHWVRKGAGAWTGWCIPWASILNSRCNQPDAAVTWLHWWKDVFTNIGHGTLHNGDFAGATIFGPIVPMGFVGGEHHEIMQIEAGMGAVTAVQELLVQQRGETLAILPAIPRLWRSFSFDGIWVEGAFRVGASVEAGKVREVRVEATRAGTLRFSPGFQGAYSIDGQESDAAVIERSFTAGETLVLRALS